MISWQRRITSAQPFAHCVRRNRGAGSEKSDVFRYPAPRYRVCAPTRYLLIAGRKGELRQMAENRTVLFLHFYFLDITKTISLNWF